MMILSGLSPVLCGSVTGPSALTSTASSTPYRWPSAPATRSPATSGAASEPSWARFADRSASV